MSFGRQMEACGLVPRGLLRAAREVTGRRLLHPLHQPRLVVEGADRRHEGFGHRIRKQKHLWFERIPTQMWGFRQDGSSSGNWVCKSGGQPTSGIIN